MELLAHPIRQGCDRAESGSRSIMVRAVGSLSESYPAVADSVSLARERLAAFAAGAGATAEQLDAVRLAASEALTNVVMHAYPKGRGRIHLTAGLAGGELSVLIADDGCGMLASADSPGLGLGLAWIAQASDDFSIAPRSSGGTEVRMRFRLGTQPA